MNRLYYPELSYIYPVIDFDKNINLITEQIKVLSLFFDQVFLGPDHLSYRILRNNKSIKKLLDDVKTLIECGKICTAIRMPFFYDLDNYLYHQSLYLIDAGLVSLNKNELSKLLNNICEIKDILNFESFVARQSASLGDFVNEEIKQSVDNNDYGFMEMLQINAKDAIKLNYIINNSSFEKLHDGTPFCIPFSYEKFYVNLFKNNIPSNIINNKILPKYFEVGSKGTNSLLLLPSRFMANQESLKLFFDNFKSINNLYFSYKDLLLVLKYCGIETIRFKTNINILINRLLIDNEFEVAARCVSLDLIELSKGIYHDYGIIVFDDLQISESILKMEIDKKYNISNAKLNMAYEISLDLISLFLPIINTLTKGAVKDKFLKFISMRFMLKKEWRTFRNYVNKL